MATEDEVIDVLERKIERLEKLVYGANIQAPLIESLLSANTLLNAAANERRHIGCIYKRLNELNLDLREESLSEPGAELDHKINVVLSLEDQYKNNAELLAKIARLDAALDQGNLKCIEEARAELIELVDQYASLSAKVDNSNTAAEILSAWKSLVVEVSRAFSAANDALLTEESNNDDSNQ